jgi:hypothetical protein
MKRTLIILALPLLLAAAPSSPPPPAQEAAADFNLGDYGELEVVDVFDSPTLYAKLERKLLASYVLAALEKQPGRAGDAAESAHKARSLKKKDIDDFVKGAAPQTGSSSEVENQVFRTKGKAVHGTFFGAKKRK